MILFDTNILIDYWRKPEELLKLHITPENFSICGVVKSELLHGARDEEDISKMLQFFQSFNVLTMDEYDWEGIGFILQALRKSGFQIPLPDAIIAFTAMKYDVPLWTNDSHFHLIQSLYPELELYNGGENQNETAMP